MNVKPGDLAYLKTPSGENDGRVVEVVRFYCLNDDYGPIWSARSVVPMNIYDVYSNEYLGSKTEFECPDNWLRPISGVPVQDEIADEVTV